MAGEVLTYLPSFDPPRPAGNTLLPRPVNPATPAIPGATPPAGPPAPTFQDIISRLSTPINNTPSSDISPETKAALDIIDMRSKEGETRAVSNATALAGRRGLAGSSIEQFGAAQAASDAQNNAQDQRASLLLGDLNSRRTQAQQAAQLELEKNLRLAGFTSDEIASIRNQQFAQQNLDLQKSLGQQGLDIARENIGASKDIASDAARNNLYGSILSGSLPFVLPALFGGGGGGGGAGLIPSLFGGSGAAASTGVGASPGLGGLGANPLSLYGTGTAGAAGTGGVPAAGGAGFLPLAALAIGGVAGYQSLSDKGKSIVAPLVNPVKTAQTISHTVSKSIKKAFPF